MREDAIIKAFDKRTPFSEVNTLSSLMLAGDDILEAPAKPTPEEALADESTV